MAFKKVKRVEVSCDECGEEMRDWEDRIPLFESENDAISELDAYDWIHTEDGKSLCPGCQEVVDD